MRLYLMSLFLGRVDAVTSLTAYRSKGGRHSQPPSASLSRGWVGRSRQSVKGQSRQDLLQAIIPKCVDADLGQAGQAGKAPPATVTKEDERETRERERG